MNCNVCLEAGQWLSSRSGWFNSKKRHDSQSV